MSVTFNKKTWKAHDTITSVDLNRVENAVADAIQQVNANSNMVSSNLAKIQEIADNGNLALQFSDRIDAIDSKVSAALAQVSANAASFAAMQGDFNTAATQTSAAITAAEAATARVETFSATVAQAEANSTSAVAVATQAQTAAGAASIAATNATTTANEAKVLAEGCKTDAQAAAAKCAADAASVANVLESANVAKTNAITAQTSASASAMAAKNDADRAQTAAETATSMKTACDAVEAQVRTMMGSISATPVDRDPMLDAFMTRILAMESELRGLKLTNPTAVELTDGAAVSKPSANVTVDTTAPVTLVKTITAKSIVSKQLQLDGNSSITFKATEDIAVSNVQLTGVVEKSTANCPLNLSTNGPITMTHSSLDGKSYNGVECGLVGDLLPSAVTLDDIYVKETTNNAFNIFGMQEGGVATISNCTVDKCDNFLRISNKANTSFTVNIVNCNINTASTGIWTGIVCCQDYQNSKDPEAALVANQFSPDKIVINFVNCTHNGQPLKPTTAPATLFGSKGAAQLLCVTTDGKTVLDYDASRYPTVNFS